LTKKWLTYSSVKFFVCQYWLFTRGGLIKTLSIDGSGGDVAAYGNDIHFSISISIGFCHTRPISLCVYLSVFMCVYFVFLFHVA